MSLRTWLFGRDVRDTIIEDLRAQLRDERERSQKLMRVVVRMKVAGGSIPRAIPTVARPRVVDEVQERITEALDANPRTRRPGDLRTRHRAWAERKLALDPNAVARIEARLRSWGMVDGASPDDDDDVIAVSHS